MGEAVRSGKLLTQSRKRLWAGTTTEEESRVYLQTRLNAYSKLMFWSFVVLLLFLGAAYRLYDIAPRYADIVFGGSAVMLAVMALVWRALLVRKQLSVENLYRVDLVYAITIGSCFAASAAIQFDLRPSAYTSLVFACYNVFTRALFVPSSARRTAVVSTITLVPIIASGVYLGLTTRQDLPTGAYIGGGVMLSAIAVLIAANGSGIIYGLTEKVKEVMQLGQYTVGRKIGEGGMGSVHRASHALLRRPTAIKLMLADRPEDLARFEEEVQHMSQLSHPNTVAIYDYGQAWDGRFYYAMEYLDGINLEQLVKQAGAQPSGRVIHILAQVCGALQEAHAAGIIHRDIKPANIILCERGGVPDVAKVVDFGLVKVVATRGAATQSILGTPGYIAPEVLTDPDQIGPAVDLYALGAVGYFLLTGRRVFEGKSNVGELLAQHVTQQPRPMREVCTRPIPPELEAVIMKCLEKQPADRYASARALADALVPVPPQPLRTDWDPDEARRWWRDFRAADPHPPETDIPTQTITVDLEKRSA